MQRQSDQESVSASQKSGAPETPETARPAVAQELSPREPPQTEFGRVLIDLGDLREKVARIDGIREGQHRATTALSIFIGLIGLATLVQFASTAIDARVKRAVDEQVTLVSGDLEQRLKSASDAALSAENSAGRAQAASSAADAAAATAQSAAGAVNLSATQSAKAAYAGEWIVIFSSSTTPESAIADAGKLVSGGYFPSVYKVGDSYVSAIGPFPSREQAQIAELALAAQFRRSLNLMNLSVTCPYRRFFQAGFFGCYFEPQPTSTP